MYHFKNSTSIASVKHENVDNCDYLCITFNSGKTYRYKNAPKSIMDEMIKSDSPGKFFQKNVRGVYDHVVDEE